MDDDQLTAVSPRHSVRLASEYLLLFNRAPSRDFVVRTITRREANGSPLMSADIVIASEETRARFPLANTYPLHFRKTYYPGRLHGDPKHEVDSHARASKLIGLPPPIGFTDSEFRACLIPGMPYNRMSPFGVEPEEANLPRAQAMPLATAAGLWLLLERAFALMEKLHAGGLAHGDAETHNFIVCPSPLEIVLIDYEVAIAKESVPAERWEKTCRQDMVPLLREALLLETRLGPQEGALAVAAAERRAECFKNPERIWREIDRSSSL